MIPLWTTAIRPVQSVCGWAFTSLGAPWVAQRVCPIPRVPFMERVSGRLAGILPHRLYTSTWDPRVATPKES